MITQTVETRGAVGHLRMALCDAPNRALGSRHRAGQDLAAEPVELDVM